MKHCIIVYTIHFLHVCMYNIIIYYILYTAAGWSGFCIAKTCSGGYVRDIPLAQCTLYSEIDPPPLQVSVAQDMSDPMQ